MKRTIVLLHGLPGSGKSTLARGITHTLPDLYYADIAGHAGFRKTPMSDLYAELYELNGAGKSLIIEGVLPTIAYRDALLSKLMGRFQVESPFDAAIVIGLFVDLKILASRRNRSLADYEKMAAKVQIGSANFEYVTFHAAASDSTHDVKQLACIIQDFLRA